MNLLTLCAGNGSMCCSVLCWSEYSRLFCFADSCMSALENMNVQFESDQPVITFIEASMLFNNEISNRSGLF